MKMLDKEKAQPKTSQKPRLLPAVAPSTRAPRAHVWVAQLIQVVFFTNIVIIVGIWVNGGNVTSVHSATTLLTSLGRITGLLAAYFLLVQVLLLTRLPFLKAITGFDRLTIWDRRNGRFTVLLILAHVGCIVSGYALMDHLSLGGEMVSLLVTYPGMIPALVGTVLLLTVGVTSAAIVRCRLRYETWYAVHLMAYLGVFLTWFHQIPNGNELVLSPLPDAYWAGLYLATLQLVVMFRVIQPLLRALWHGLRVVEVIPEGPGVVSLRMAGRHEESIMRRSLFGRMIPAGLTIMGAAIPTVTAASMLLHAATSGAPTRAALTRWSVHTDVAAVAAPAPATTATAVMLPRPSPFPPSPHRWPPPLARLAQASMTVVGLTTAFTSTTTLDADPGWSMRSRSTIVGPKCHLLSFLCDV
jgi:hypothetical protein